jgi:hypothetical protein
VTVLRDRYGRTPAEVKELERQAGYEHFPLDCWDDDCPDWVLSTDGLFWTHSHPKADQ